MFVRHGMWPGIFYKRNFLSYPGLMVESTETSKKVSELSVATQMQIAELILQKYERIIKEILYMEEILFY